MLQQLHSYQHARYRRQGPGLLLPAQPRRGSGKVEGCGAGDAAPVEWHDIIDPTVTPGGYDLTVLVCQDGDPQGVTSTTYLDSRTATVNLEPSEMVTCTFRNTKRGKIIVEQEHRPRGDPISFAFSGKISASLADGQRIIVSGLQAGTYASRELVPRAWHLANIECDDGVGVADRDSSGDLATATATFRLQAGELVTYTFTDRRLYDLYLPLVLR